MLQYNQRIILKDGRLCILRNGTAQDGQAALDTFILAHSQTDYLLTYPDEITFTANEQAEYLQKIKDYCAENDMELMFVTAPHVEEADKAHEIYNRVEQMALDEGYLFLNGMKLFDELGIDCSKDFNDESHLNYWGSCKYTRYLGKLIKESYELPDRRGQEGYESWDRHVEEIKRKVEQNA